MQIMRGLYKGSCISITILPSDFYVVAKLQSKICARLMCVDYPKYGGVVLGHRTIPLLKAKDVFSELSVGLSMFCHLASDPKFVLNSLPPRV